MLERSTTKGHINHGSEDVFRRRCRHCGHRTGRVRNGRCWCVGLGRTHAIGGARHQHSDAIWLKVNGQAGQAGRQPEPDVWSVAEQISKLSEANELFPGDIIDSGTPANGGPVVRGDVIEMHIDGLPNLSVRIE
jgi:ribosomal protein L37E